MWRKKLVQTETDVDRHFILPRALPQGQPRALSQAQPQVPVPIQVRLLQTPNLKCVIPPSISSLNSSR